MDGSSFCLLFADTSVCSFVSGVSVAAPDCIFVVADLHTLSDYSNIRATLCE